MPYVDSDAEYRKLLTDEQQETLKWVEANGGSATYDPSSEINLDVSLDGSAFGDEALQRLVSLRDELRWLGIEKTRISSAGLEVIGTWPCIETLILPGLQINDECLRHLSSLTELTYLRLDGTSICGVGLRHLHVLSKLDTLILRDTQIDDEGLKHIAGITSLKEISLVNTAVTAAGLAYLQDMPNLKYVVLDNTAVTFEEGQFFHIYLPVSLEDSKELREHYENHGWLPKTEEEWEQIKNRK